MSPETSFTPASNVKYSMQYSPHYNNGAIGPQKRFIQPDAHDYSAIGRHGYASPPVYSSVCITPRFVSNKSSTTNNTTTQSDNIRVVPLELSFEHRTAHIEVVLRACSNTINHLPITAQNQDAVTHALRHELTQIAHGTKACQLSHQQLVNLLSDQAYKFLELKKKQLQSIPLSKQPLLQNRYKESVADISPNYPQLKRSDSSLSECSTAAITTPTQLVQRKIPISELINRANKKLADSRRSQHLQRKHYPDFERSFYIDHKTVTDPVRLKPVNNKIFNQQERQIRAIPYNKHCKTIYPLGEYAFFHQHQTGPYCQTVSINNFLGEDLLTPDSLTELMSLGKKHIGKELGAFGTLELFSKLRIEQRKKLEQLDDRKAALLMSSDQQSIKNAKILLEELNCRICKIKQNDTKQIERFICAANAAKVNRLYLAFTTDIQPDGSTIGHAIALRRDPQNSQLWLVLDSNLPPHRRPLNEILTSYCHKGALRLIAHKNLFKQDPSIACYQIKQVSQEENLKLVVPTSEQNSHWHSVSPQQALHKKYKNPDSFENDLYHWKQRKQAKLISQYV